jgi:hypothetical protein
MNLSFKQFFRRKDDASKNTRGNYGNEGKSWYHPESNTFVPVTRPYHTQEVFHHPQKFNMNDDDIRGFYTSKNSKTDPDRDMNLFRGHDFMDWSDEVVHGMHDKGWLRVTHNQDNKHMYIGGNNANTAGLAVRQMVKHNHIGPDHKVTVHLYDYGKEGYNGKTFNLTYDQAKRV